MSFIFRKRSGSQASRPASMRSTLTTGTSDDVPEPEVLGGEARMSQRSERRGTLPGHSRERSRSGSDSMHVRSGFMNKKGVINQAWKKRWFVLTSKSLLYFEEQPGETDAPRGVIPLVIVTRVDVKSEGERERLNVVTPSRVYKIKAESVADAEAWVAAISGAVEIEKKQQTGRRERRPSISVLDSLKAEGNAVVFEADARIHTPADTQKWESWGKFEVAAYLTTFGAGLHSGKFFTAGVTGKQLAGLSSADLEKMGISKKPDQLSILKNISSLVKGEISGATPSSSSQQPRPLSASSAASAGRASGGSGSAAKLLDEVDGPIVTPMTPATQ